MLKTMIFIDFENFYIALKDFCDENNLNYKIDYKKLSTILINECNQKHLTHEKHSYIKTYVFYPEPDKKLKESNFYLNELNWINMLNDFDYFEVIKGRHICRPTGNLKYEDININDKTTYYKVEKGTDINLANTVLTKAFNNSFDVAIIISGDSDYIPVLDTLRNLGKIVIICAVENQRIEYLKKHSDSQIFINKEIINNCFKDKTKTYI